MTKRMVKNAQAMTIGGLILVLVLTATPAASLTGATVVVQEQDAAAEKLAERAAEAGETPAVVATFSRKLTDLVPSGRAGERR